jgi:hypothetical protein
MAAFTAAGRSLVPIWDALHARQMGGQGLAYWCALGLGESRGSVAVRDCWRGCRQLYFQFPNQRLQLGLVEQRQLAVGDVIGARTEALAP